MSIRADIPKQTSVIQVRCYDDEKRELERKAAGVKLSVSAYVRQVLFGAKA